MLAVFPEKSIMSIPNALCILDGGYLSAACATVTAQQFEQVHAVTCNVGRRSQIELESAIAVADMLRLASHEVIDLSPIFSKPVPLTLGQLHNQDRLVLGATDGGDSTISSASSLLILTMATNNAAEKGINNIIVSGCREDFAHNGAHLQTILESMSQLLGEGLWRDSKAVTIHTPLKEFSKAECIHLANGVLGERFQEFFELTHDCSFGVEGGCGQCPSCWSRDRAFQEADVEDPIWKFRHPEFGNFISQGYQSLPGIR